MVFLGIGSELRGDDGWAWRLIETLKSWRAPEVHALWGATVPENVLAPLARLRPAEVLLCDAGLFPGAPGSLTLAEPGAARESFAFSHRLPLAFLAEQIAGRTGSPVHLLLMRPERLELGEGLSPVVRVSLEELLAELRPHLLTDPTLEQIE